MGDRSSDLSHLDDRGAARMVDTSDKPDTARTATAEGFVRMAPSTFDVVKGGPTKKGSVIEVARLAGIMGAKRTADLIPLCHPITLSGVTVDLEMQPPDRVRIIATVRTVGATGVEMEALSAVSVAALTFYDMIKSIDREARLEDIALLEKTGGKSGHFERSRQA